MALGAFQTHLAGGLLWVPTCPSQGMMVTRREGRWALGNLPWCCTDGTRHFLSWHLPPRTAGFRQAAAFCGMEYEPQRLSEPNRTRHFLSAVSFQFLIEPTFDRFGILSVFQSSLFPSSSPLPPPFSILWADFQSPHFKEVLLHKEQKYAMHRKIQVQYKE